MNIDPFWHAGLSLAAMSDREGFHEDFGREEKVVGSSDRAFGFVFTVVFALIAAFQWWYGNGWWPYWLAASAATLAISVAVPRILRPVNRLWMLVGLLLHKIINPVIMALLFFACIAPMAMLMRLFRRQFISIRYDKAAKSYWINRDPPGPRPDTMKHQF
jgi:hypothetical protein